MKDQTVLISKVGYKRGYILAFLALFVGAGIVILAYSHAAVPVNGYGIKDTNYPAPANAIYVAPGGSDTAAGSMEQPLKTLSAAVAKAPSGGTIVLRAGTYRESINSISKRLTLQPYPHEKAWMKGSEVVTNWVPDGTLWRKDNWTQQFCETCYDPNAITTTDPLAGKPDQVFVNNSALTQVASKAEVRPGTFFVDTAAAKLYVGSDPSQKLVEASTFWKALQINSDAASGSIIRGIGFSQYASYWNEDQLASVIINAPDVTFENNTVTQMAGTGFASASGSSATKLIGNTISGNGYRGALMNKVPNAVIKDNRFEENNLNGYKYIGCDGICTVAGIKITKMADATVSNNFIRNNRGNGFWCDQGCTNLVFTSNVVQNNALAGMFFEVSSHAIVASNLFTRNGFGFKLAGSDHVQLYNNTFARNGSNLAIYDDARKPKDYEPYSASLGLTWDTTNTTIRNNILANNDGTAAPFFDSNKQDTNTTQMIEAMDHNAILRSDATVPATLFRWCPATGCVNVASVDALRSLTGLSVALAQHVYSNVAADTLFTNEPAGDYSVRANSTTGAGAYPLPADIAAAVGVPSASASLGFLKLPNITNATSPSPSVSATPISPTPSPTLAPTLSPTPSPTASPVTRKTGDVTGQNGVPDGKVDVLDLSYFIVRFGTSSPACDFNGSGTVDILDLSIILGAWG